MRITRKTATISGVMIALTLAASFAISALYPADAQDNSKLVVVWTSGDKDVAIKMVYMYTFNAKKQGWFDDVTFVIWGPSSKLLSEDAELQEYLGRMKEAGINLQACIACANMYGVTDKLRSMGVEVKGMGKPLTDMLKADYKVITF